MIKLFVYASVAAVVGLAAVSAAAQSPIERLVEQTGVEEAAVASRELPRWREPTRVIVRARYDAADVIASELPGAEVIVVTSAAEALPQIADAEAIIGFCPEDLIAAGSWVRQSILLRENVRRFAAGEPLLNVVDPEPGC